MPKARKSTKSKKTATAKSAAFNRNAQWKAYKQLQMRADKAWQKLRSDVKKNASPAVLLKGRNQLLLLLGECNYMTRECMRMASQSKKR